jgi:hypothetical protein
MTKLLSFQKKLTNEFVKHIETTNDLCLYRFSVFSIPRSVIFPNATYLTLINCSKSGISNILNPDIFPNIHTINYLSTNPDKNLLHTRFSSHVNWIFPDKNYDFYNFMTDMGYGKKDSNIIKKYIHNKRILDGKNGFDISYEVDINIPEYGIVNGTWWQSQFYEYLVSMQNKGLINKKHDCLNQEQEEKMLEKNKVINELDRIDFD